LRRAPGATLVPYTTLFRSGQLGWRAWCTRAEPGLGPGRRWLYLIDARVGQHDGPVQSDARQGCLGVVGADQLADEKPARLGDVRDRKSTRLNSSHVKISYA